MSNELLKKDEVSLSSDTSPKSVRIKKNSELRKRLEKETEEMKAENKKLRYIIEDKNQEQIKMLKKEIRRQRFFDKKSAKVTEKITVILIALFIIINLIELLFFRRK